MPVSGDAASLDGPVAVSRESQPTMITSLQIAGFRNIKNSSFKPAEGVNLFHGRNGAGKTNVLEAIGLFSIGKSCRGAKDVELVNFDSGLAEISAEITVEKKKSLSP